MEDVCLERLHEFIRVACCVLGLYKARYPFELVIHVRLGLFTALVFPVRRNAVFGDLVHLARSYLDLKRYTVASDDRSMERAVHIGLRHGDIILESARHRLEHLVDYTEHGIAFKLGTHDYAQRVKVVYLIKALVLIIHLAVYAVYRFDAPLKHKVNIVLAQLGVHRCADVFDEVLILTVFFLDIVLDLCVSDGIEVEQSEVFKLLLDPLHTEAVSERCIYLHRFKRYGALFFLRFCAQCAHIVESVAELYKDDAYIL